MRHEFTRDELREIRRQFINEYIQETRFLQATLSEIKSLVRLLERVNYGEELKIYAN